MDASRDTSRERLAALWPALEQVPLAGHEGAGTLVPVVIDASGRPVPDAGETVSSRWIAACLLALDLDGAVTPDGRASLSVIVFEGALRLMVTDRRVVGSFNSAVVAPNLDAFSGTPVAAPPAQHVQMGGPAPAVIVLSWPLDEISCVQTLWAKRWRSTRFTSLELRGDHPTALMRFETAVPADEVWTGPRRGDPVNDGSGLAALGRSVAQASAQYRLARGLTHGTDLDAILADRWVDGDGISTAYLVPR